MARRNISLPDEVDDAARLAGVNVSAIARDAVLAELDRQRRLAALDAELRRLDSELGPVSDRRLDEADAWLDGAMPVEPVGRRRPRAS